MGRVPNCSWISPEIPLSSEFFSGESLFLRKVNKPREEYEILNRCRYSYLYIQCIYIYINNYSIWLMVRYMLPIVELAFEIV